MFLLWDRAQLLSALQARIVRKIKIGREGLTNVMLVIHIDEFSLDRDTVAQFLQGATFQTQLLTDVFLGLSFGSNSVFRLDLLRRA